MRSEVSLPSTMLPRRQNAGVRPVARPVIGVRALMVIVHRWAGLTIALFLIVAGVTGAVLPWQEPITALVTPSRLALPSPHGSGARPILAAQLAAIVQRRTGALVYASLDYDPRRTVTMFAFAKPGSPPLAYDEVVVDPYTGAIRGTYRWGRLADGAQNIMPFLFSLHYGVVAGEWGRFAFGIAALVWTIDCFVGFYLTFPARRRSASHTARSASDWWARWRHAWAFRRPWRGFKLTFDLHRAGGLWLWPLLLVFAWSSVGQNLPQVHHPIMRLLGEGTPPMPPMLAAPLGDPPIGPVAAVAAAERELAVIARRRGLPRSKPTALVYQPAQGAYRIQAAASGGDGAATLWIGGESGRLLQYDPSAKPAPAGRIDALFDRLHFAQIGGVPYRIFVSFFGLLVAGLSVTGVLIWSRKRTARMTATMHRRARRVDRGQTEFNGAPSARR